MCFSRKKKVIEAWPMGRKAIIGRTKGGIRAQYGVGKERLNLR